LAAVVEVLASGSGCTATGATFNYYLLDPSTGTGTSITGLTHIAWADAIYDQSSGVLTDIVFFDSGAQKLGVYPYTLGSNPFLTAATYVSGNFAAAKSLRYSQFGSTLVAATPATGSAVQTVYKFASGSTSAQSIYTEPGPGAIGAGTGLSNPRSAETDGANVYFVDTVTSGSQYLVQINQNGTTKTLYTNTTPTSTPMAVLGADGTRVLVSVQAAGGTSNATTWNLYPLPIGITTTSLPTAPYTFTGLTTFGLPIVTSELAVPGNGSSTLVFVNMVTSLQGPTRKYSGIVNPSATLAATLVPNTWLLPSSVGNTGTVLQVQNITDAQATFIGGGTINKIVLSGNFPSTTLTAPGGGSVTVPPGDVDIDFTTSLGGGVVAGVSLASGDALICTLASNQIVVLTPASNTWLVPF
jgi:hypothetical protein